MTSLASSSYRTDYAMTLVGLFSFLALVDSLFNYFWTGNGIHGSEGALLVIVSTLLTMLAAGLIVTRWVRGWLRGLFEVLLALDFVGTALAAYLLEAWVLLAFVIIAALAWIVHLIRPASPVSNLG